ncbi:dihydroorotase family protein [Marinoscillum sp. MHG1-6]|uniref:dihydroorotase n=1 Tax=Marinoscillum sp. MHG1-6 TaxID=2959627 RepID=UPI0021571F7A|nr:dihydroorotase [Marinoscillum sp. MHG1-6]
MKIGLANATVFDPSSKFHLQTVDILIEDGIIKKIGKGLKGADIDLSGKWVSLGFAELSANFCEPGNEHKEDISSGIEVAVSGGFTDVCVAPDTQPALETKGGIQFVRGKSGKVSLWPIAAVSEELKGENLTEILDLNHNGAVAFSDGVNPIWNTELLLKALQYVQKFEGLIINRPKDVGLSRHAHMHEGAVSTSLGLNGEPSVSEELTIQRDIEILKYAGGRIHFSQISTEKSVDLIKKAKAEGLKVTCDVSINHLLFSDKDLETFDTNYKVDPPLRTSKDRKALIKGLKSGVIDAISTAHQPQDQECKDLEFDLADFGAIGLQTAFAALNSIKDELPLEVSIEKITRGPRTVVGLDQPEIAEGAMAKLAVFDPEEKWTFDKSNNKSKSFNSPFVGKELTGKSLGTINGKITSLEILEHV